MVRSLIACFALVTAPLLQSASAQVVASAMSKAPPPGDLQAAVPPTTYRSAFGSYRPSSDDPVISWREANDLVERIGGWRVYAREAQQPAAADRTPATPAPHKH